MKDKTKRTLLIAAGALLCVALVFGIGSRLGGRPQTIDPAQESDVQNNADPVVDIDTPAVNVDIDANGNMDKDEAKPGAGADSSGTEQTIQEDAVKPEAPEPPTAYEADHDGSDMPESERNAATPPTYTPEQVTVTPQPTPTPGGTNSSGQMYVPGFGYVSGGGESQGVPADNIYENGNKVGIMD